MRKAIAALCVVACLVVVAAPVPAEDKDAGPPPGFVALFNGKDLTGWQGVIDVKTRARLSPEELAKKQEEVNAKVLPHWTVADGGLHYDGKGDSLQTAKDYGNFELLVDWKIQKAGDSGIYLRGNPQVQIWDSDNLPPQFVKDKGTGSGGLWNNRNHPNQPLKRADKPVGQWNTFRIHMVGAQVTVYLNGELVVDKVPLENYWEKDKPLPAKGPIELQHHNDPLWFRHIYIRELPD
jgi:Domain of Unknown Function (DUF1080)